MCNDQLGHICCCYSTWAKMMSTWDNKVSTLVLSCLARGYYSNFSSFSNGCSVSPPLECLVHRLLWRCKQFYYSEKLFKYILVYVTATFFLTLQGLGLALWTKESTEINVYIVCSASVGFFVCLSFDQDFPPSINHG